MFNFLLLLLAALNSPSIGVTHTHLIISVWIKVKKSQSDSEKVLFENEESHMWPKTMSREWTKHLLHCEWRITLCTRFRWSCMTEWTKSRFEVLGTSNDGNKYLNDEAKASPVQQSNELSLTKQKMHFEWTTNEFKKINFEEKNQIKKSKKRKKSIWQDSACEEKTNSKKAIFVQSSFSHSTSEREN